MSLNTDNYNFLKASEPQNVDTYSPYVDKQFNNIPDINSGVYQNSTQTFVNFDLKSIYNSSSLTDTADLYYAIPLISSAVISKSDGTILTPPALGASLMTLKSNYMHLIHQVDLTCDGKTIQSSQQFLSMIQYFKLLSSLSASDLKNSSTTWGMSEILDTPNSVQWLTRQFQDPNSSTAGTPSATTSGYASMLPGVGLCNNQVIGMSSTPAFGFQAGATNVTGQNGGCINEALARRASRCVDLVNKTFNNLYGAPTAGAQPTILSAAQLNAEFRPYYTVSGNYMYWYDIAIIPVRFICDALDKIGLTKKLDMQMKLYLNTGYLQVPVEFGLNTGATTVQYGAHINSTFVNTCPFTLNLIPTTNYSITPAANVGGSFTLPPYIITAGIFVAKALNSNIAVGTNTPTSINFATNAANHPMPSCRVYYSQIALSPAYQEQYINENRNKVVVYENFEFNSFANISAGGSFSQPIKSGVKNPLGILVVPLISTTCPTTVGGSTYLGFSQYASPFDTCPASSSPCSLINLQVNLGGKPVLGTTLYYTYENFVQQVALAQTIINEVSLNVGVIDQKWWEANRYYWVDLGRAKDADKASMRNLSLSFQSNSSVPIDIMVFTVYLDKLVIDVETGIVRKE
jgi:hypothetical protein